MDKFSEIFKATVAVFHGIIATWFFVDFSETGVDQLGFLILLVFFTVINVLIWNLILILYYRVRSIAATIPLTTNDIAALSYRAVDVVGLMVVALTVGLTSAYIYRQDVVLSTANLFANWRRTYSDAPFVVLLSNVVGRTMNVLDGRDREIVRAASGRAYLRVYLKDSKFAYEGFPSIAANKRDPREIVLSPACRFVPDGLNALKAPSPQMVEGPRVFIRLADTASFEIIDRYRSECATLHDKAATAAAAPKSPE